MRTMRGARTIVGIVATLAMTAATVSCAADDDTGSDSSSSQTPTADPSPNDGAADDDSTQAADDSGETKAKAEPTETSDANDGEDESPEPKRRAGHTYSVLEVVDGDTVHLDKPGETSVRIIGIDTPETVHPSEPVECGGPAASKEAERILSGATVRLVYDPTQGRVDYYGRVLGYIDVPGLGDFGEHMIEDGFAAEYTYDTAYRRRPQYLAAQNRAKNASRGVWGKCGGVDTPLEQPTEEPTSEPSPTEDAGGNCATGYDPCVPAYPPDLDCADVDGPINITGDDPHGFDADGDGIGCDS